VQGIGRIGAMTVGRRRAGRTKNCGDADGSRREFIEENKKGPFFLYFATHDIHVPRVPAARFRGHSGAGVRGDTIEEFDWSVGELFPRSPASS